MVINRKGKSKFHYFTTFSTTPLIREAKWNQLEFMVKCSNNTNEKEGKNNEKYKKVKYENKEKI